MGERENQYLRMPDHKRTEWCLICGKETWFTDHQEAVQHVRQEHLDWNKQKQQRITEVSSR